MSVVDTDNDEFCTPLVPSTPAYISRELSVIDVLVVTHEDAIMGGITVHDPTSLDHPEPTKRKKIK
jgi:hypothetical protein